MTGDTVRGDASNHSVGGAMPGEDFSRYVSVVELRVDSHYTDGVVSLGTIVEMFGIAGTKLA